MKKQEVFGGVILLKPESYGDDRGFFMESYSKKSLSELGIHCEFVQDNHSGSAYNVLRGMHYQAWPGHQAKLIRVTSGEIIDVVVDIRPDSPTFLKNIQVPLNAYNRQQLFIPNGFAHGFYVLSDFAEVQYKCSNYYDAELEKGYAWNTPAFNIDWPLREQEPILSDRDKNNPDFML